MTIEMTATVLIGPLEQGFGGTSFRGRHLLTLKEHDRATWELIPLDPAEARQSLRRSAPAALRPTWTVGRPDAPQNLLAHGLLTFLIAIAPEMVMTDPELSRLAHPDSGRGGIATTVPDDEAVALILSAVPRQAGLVVTLLQPCTIDEVEVAALRRAGLSVGCTFLPSPSHGVPQLSQNSGDLR